MSDNQGVLILGEIEDGKLASITKELLGIGRKLASDLGQGLSAILIGNGAKDLAQEAIAYGADKVLVADNAALASYSSDGYTAVAAEVCRDTAPFIVLMGQSPIGRDVAPRLAARLGVALAPDCIELKIDADSKKLIQVRPVYGGNAVAEVVSKTTPQLATIRLKSMTPAEADSARSGEVVNVDIADVEIKAKVVNVIKEEVEGIKIEDAGVVVAGGAGVVGTEGWDMVKELAKVLGGAVGATRPPVEEGLISNSVQIGQTGKMIAPDLYIAVGISGAQQHMAGCDASKVIVAVNRDAEAEIFRLADVGVVGDAAKVMPVLTAKCKELLS